MLQTSPVGVELFHVETFFCSINLYSRWLTTWMKRLFCYVGVSVQDVQVRLGKIFTNRAEPSREQLISADRILIFPHYDHHRNDYDRDVALIRLKTAVIYTDYVRPICLPLRPNDKDKFLLRPGMIGVITGKKIIMIFVTEHLTINCFLEVMKYSWTTMERRSRYATVPW